MDYSNGKIYKIVSDQCELPYIGSTTKSIEYRFRKHRDKYNCWLNGKSNFNTSFEILKYGDARVELIEDYPCNYKEELEKREGLYIQVGINCVNKQRAGSNGNYKIYQKNWYNIPENKAKQAELQKAPHRKEYARKKFECVCGKMIGRNGLKDHKRTQTHILFLENPEAYKKMKDRLKNEKIDNPKYKCECGSEITNKSSSINTHNKRKHHIKFMNNKLKSQEEGPNIV
jgi:hypothetical protein